MNFMKQQTTLTLWQRHVLQVHGTIGPRAQLDQGVQRDLQRGDGLGEGMNRDVLNQCGVFVRGDE